MGDITPNFSYYEFRPNGSPKTWMPESEYRKILVKTLAENLQEVRSRVPRGTYMKITSGVRTGDDYDRLINLGYHPSQTSDHYAGFAPDLPKNHKRYKKFGSTYNFAVRAADVVPVNMKVYDLFTLSVRLQKEGLCDFGQIIYEYDSEKNKEWVHYGNSLKPFFSKKIIDMIGRIEFMKTADGGRSYSIVEGLQA